MNLSRRDAVVDKWVERITRWNVTMLAILFLEMHKPLRFIGSQMLLFAQPFFTDWGDSNAVGELTGLFADCASVEQLLARLEEAQSRESCELS